MNLRYQFPGDSLQTVVMIAADSNRIVERYTQLGYVDYLNEREDSIYFYNFEVRIENRTSKRNFKDKKYWKFKKDDDLHASYILTIDDSFFN